MTTTLEKPARRAKTAAGSTLDLAQLRKAVKVAGMAVARKSNKTAINRHNRHIQRCNGWVLGGCLRGVHRWDIHWDDRVRRLYVLSSQLEFWQWGQRLHGQRWIL